MGLALYPAQKRKPGIFLNYGETIVSAFCDVVLNVQISAPKISQMVAASYMVLGRTELRLV